MTKFYFSPLIFCAAMLLSASVAHAKDKPPEVSKNTFVSLQIRHTTLMRPRFEIYTIRNHRIFQKVTIPKRYNTEKAPPPQSKTLSPSEWTQLLGQLKKLNVPAIAGRYSHSGLRDGSSQNLELTLIGRSRRRHLFSIRSYGHKAPAAFYAFQDYFSTLIKRKFG